MNGLEFLADKIGRKQLITIAAMIILAQMGAPSWQVMGVAFAGITSQFVIDWRKKKTNKPTTPPE